MPRVQKTPLRPLTADERHHLERINRSQIEPDGQGARAKALLLRTRLVLLGAGAAACPRWFRRLHSAITSATTGSVT